MYQNKKSLYLHLTLAVFSVTFFYQVSFIPFINDMQEMKDSANLWANDSFGQTATSIRLSNIFFICDLCSFGVSIAFALVTNFISGRKIFVGWYWRFMALLFLWMFLSYRLGIFYFLDILSFKLGFLFPLVFWQQSIINLVVHGTILMWIYQKIWMMQTKIVPENPGSEL